MYWQKVVKKMINEFKNEYFFLSNFYRAPVSYNGMHFSSSEAAFQAQKCPEKRIEFFGLSPSKAKALGRKMPLRADWETVKDGIMEDIVFAKFEQNPPLLAKLLETGNEELVEGTTWNDTYWGIDLATGKGENKLGKILMKVRKHYQELKERGTEK